MLTEEHFDMLTRFRARAMGDKLREMVDDASYDRYTFEERMEMLIEAEASARRDGKVAKLVREARFKLPNACVEDVVYLPGRKFSRDRVARLASCDWVEAREVVVIISKTGCGKSFLGQALGNTACRRLSRSAARGWPTSWTTSTAAEPRATAATTSAWTPTRPSSCSSSTTS